MSPRKLAVPKPLTPEDQSAVDTVAVLAGSRQCPMCAGRGGWYVLERDVPEVGVYHILVSCRTCNASGWFSPGDAEEYENALARYRASGDARRGGISK